MPPKGPRASPVEGLDLILPSKLHVDFKKFKNDDLFYIGHCTYYPAEGKPLQRLVAVTPAAFFICDPNGKMDRATRIEALSALKFQGQTLKKMLSTVKVIAFVVKIPSEYDIFFTVEENVKGATCEPLLLCKVLDTLGNLKCKNWKCDSLDASQNIREEVKTDRPEGFLSPQEILQQNKQRQDILDRIEGTTKEVYTMRQETGILTKEVDEREKQIKAMESATGSDLGETRKKRDALQTEHVAIHRQNTTLEIEVMRLETELRDLRAKLDEEQNNFDQMVKDAVEDAQSGDSEKHAELYQLRKKAQAREISTANTKLEAAREKAKTKPTYDGPIADRANKAEDDVAAAFIALDREFSQADKMKKFFEKMNSDLDHEATLVAEKAAEKERFLDARDAIVKQKQAAEQKKKEEEEAAKKAAEEAEKQKAAPAGGDDLLGDDDDLLGGDDDGKPAASSPPAAGGDDLLGDDDDLLGGDDGPSPAASAPAASHKDPLDDDLLGGDEPAPTAGGGGGGGADGGDDDLI